MWMQLQEDILMRKDITNWEINQRGVAVEIKKYNWLHS